MRRHVKRVSQKIDKLTKEQLVSLLNAQIEENDTMYSIFESIATGLLIVDSNFYLLQTNISAETWLPFSVHLDDNRALNMPLWELIEDEDISRFFKTGFEKGLTNSSSDFSLVTSGGSVRFINITMTPFVHKKGFQGSIILVRDITEQKKQDVLFHRMENMASLTNLAAGMAHEIKNPLGAISIHIQLLQKAIKKARENDDILPSEKFVENHIETVNQEISHLNELVMDFLTAVRPINAVLELKNPAVFIKDAIEFFKPEFNSYGIGVFFNDNSNYTRIMIDEKLFREAIMNLAQNALSAIKSRYIECREKTSDFYSDENCAGRFVIECQIQENKYLVRISDNGCGMTDEVISKIFEPYFTTKADGTGLGMTRVYKIIKEFSGEILVNSKINVGTVFSLVFPIPQKDGKLLTNDSNDGEI